MNNVRVQLNYLLKNNFEKFRNSKEVSCTWIKYTLTFAKHKGQFAKFKDILQLKYLNYSVVVVSDFTEFLTLNRLVMCNLLRFQTLVDHVEHLASQVDQDEDICPGIRQLMRTEKGHGSAGNLKARVAIAN